MAATLYPSGAETGPGVHSNAYSRSMMTDYDYRDGHYPSIPTQPTSNSSVRNSAVLLGTQNMGAWEKEAKEDDEYFSRQRPMNADPTSSSSQDESSPPLQQKSSPSNHPVNTATSPQPEASSSSKYQEQPRNGISYALPQGAPRRVMERYSLENNDRPGPSSQVPADISPEEDTARIATSQTNNKPPQLALSIAPKHPSLPSAGIGAQSSNTSPAAFMPLSASPTYSPPVSTRQRAYAQQPTYIQNVSPMPVYLPRNPPAEEVCIECAMRDQDMADVDVTSPGVWERESDVHYEDLKRTQAEEEANGIINTDTPPRPRATGGRLTEANLKLWLSVNPREPTSRQQTLNTFVRAQRAFLEAEAAAHTQAMKEAQNLDNRMRDAYSQLRRSAYDTGSSAAPADDSGGIRIRPPSSPSGPAPHERSHSRDVTLLENGMIVEHVDVRKEEREARSRQKREERRARKSSRSSAFDGTSLVSSQSLILPSSPPPDNNGAGLSPYSRNSHASSLRPMSVLTSGDRPDIPRAYSQASFSDMHSLGSPSPRRSRFFGNLRNSGWLSQDSLAPSGMSGSMVDMHVALQREADRQQMVTSPVSLHRNSEYWPKPELQATPSRHSTGTAEKKKKKGLAKIWQMVSRSKDKDRAKETPESTERSVDDYPLAPPPPLSYLVDRMPGDRHASTSTPSLPSTISPKFGLSASMSFPTAPSSSIPSPTSSRRSGGADQDTISAEPKQPNGAHNLDVHPVESGRLSPRGVHPALSEPDLRGRASPNPTAPIPPLPSGRMTPVDKSLPPLPPDAVPRPNTNFTDPRPVTFYTLDSQPPPGASPVHDFAPPSAPFRGTGSGSRRQSFHGLNSRPAFLSKTVNENTSRPLTTNYDEFGGSRRSLGLKDLMAPIRNTATTATPGKRKSRFFASLLGKKSPAPEKELNGNGKDSTYVCNTPTVYGDGQEDMMTGYATSSRHSVLSSSNTGVLVSSGARISLASRKGLEDLVAQDPDFVAYRYPSQDQRIEMMK